MTPEQVALSFLPRRVGDAAYQPAYLAGLSGPVWLYARVTYMADHRSDTLQDFHRRVRAEVWRCWPMFGARPARAHALSRYIDRNAELADRLAQIVVAECVNPAAPGRNKAVWRAAQMGVSKRRWHQAYQKVFDRVISVLEAWDQEFRAKTIYNQTARV